MLNHFAIQHPGWLAAATALSSLAIVGAWLRAENRRPLKSAARRGAWTACIAAPGLALAALTLAGVRSRGSDALLLLIFAAGAAYFTARTYAHRPTNIGRPRALLCGACRLIALLVAAGMLARPTWNWTVVEWQKPLLLCLADQSRSMALADPVPSPAPAAATVPAGGHTRQQRVLTALAGAREEWASLRDTFEVRILNFGRGVRRVESLDLRATDAETGLAAALEQAARERGATGRPAAFVLVLSDGAENLQTPAAVRAAAETIAAQKSGIMALAAGPRVAQTVAIESLHVPEQVRTHERIQATVRVRAAGCAGYVLPLAFAWDEADFERRAVAVDRDLQSLDIAVETTPPGPGVHRLSVRAGLPPALGGGEIERSALVDVREDRTRVLYVYGEPGTEVAFVARALRGAAAIELTADWAPPDARPVATSRPTRWDGYDVVILGPRSHESLNAAEIAELASRVTEYGVGLLLAGGRAMFEDARFGRTELVDVCPARLGTRAMRSLDRPRFSPTAIGAEHPLLAGMGPGAELAPTGDAGWSALPELCGAAQLAPASPLAQVLADDGAGHALLVAQDVGAGRCLAAAWDCTWPWALHSDAGSERHQRLWRQMASWLANRRPRAWVITERAEYNAAALESHAQRVVIRAGVNGLDHAASASIAKTGLSGVLRRVASCAAAASVPFPGPEAQLPNGVAASRASRTEEGWPVSFEFRGGEWHAALPGTSARASELTPGQYEIQVRAVPGRPPAGDGDVAAEALSAATRFRVVEQDLERLPPTSDPGLMREIADRTAEFGGRFGEVESLPEILRELGSQDRRTRVERAVEYDPVSRRPWIVLAILAAALMGEWALRRRAGVA